MSTPSSTPRVVAAVMNDPEWDPIRFCERRRWRVALSAGPDRRRFTSTRREAVEWCIEQGIPFVVAAPVRGA